MIPSARAGLGKKENAITNKIERAIQSAFMTSSFETRSLQEIQRYSLDAARFRKVPMYNPFRMDCLDAQFNK
jgi:hypothetical protein